jgi:hypothetical protein
MAKLFVFAIGGTGSRVLRSLTMMLAAGTKLPEPFDTVVPIIIDPDSANGDMNRTTDLLLKYQQIKKAIGPTLEGDNFFNANIETLSSLVDQNSIASKNNFIFDIAGTSNTTFDQFLGYQSLDRADKALIDLLYTEGELNSDMNVGFKGKPNIGSIVLNQIIHNTGYGQFAQKFQQGDAIFIISSIFGGTGAAGFPLLLKNLRTNDPNVPGSNLISNSVIGAISYLPYFQITPPEEKEKQTIESSTFFSKAQAALYYYQHAIFGNNNLNAFYFTSDNSQNDYKHNDGKAEQQNNAHFLELAGGLAIIDFLNDVPQLATQNTKAVGTITSKEFGVIDGSRTLDFNKLGTASLKELRLHLSKFALKELFLRKALHQNLDSQTRWANEPYFTKPSFFEKDFFQRQLNPFMNSYKLWLSELENNDVAFVPFHDPKDVDTLLNFIKGNEVKNQILHLKPKAKSERLTDALNLAINELNKGEKREKEFVKIFDRATEQVIKNNILGN